MESVTVKFNEDLLKDVDARIAKHRYASRTEFIRAAVREKVERLTWDEIQRSAREQYGHLSYDELAQRFLALHGTFTSKTNKTDKEIREEVGRELMLDLDRRFGKPSLADARAQHHAKR
jgi:metal-responsive CopG/Arc/MetJ family transcriptional regulator